MHLLHMLGKTIKKSDGNLWFSQPLSLALGMTDLAHCLVKQARVHYGDVTPVGRVAKW